MRPSARFLPTRALGSGIKFSKMTTVFLTRPQRLAEQLAAALARQGYAPLCEPLLTIEFLPTPKPAPNPERPVDAVMLTSQHAAVALEARAAELGPWLDLPCWCVGQRTASAARAVGFTRVLATQGGAQALAKAMVQAAPSGRSSCVIAHICGQDVADEGLASLRRKGFAVLAWPVYAARAARRFSDPTRRALNERSVEAALFFSRRTAQTFVRLTCQDHLEACCGRITAIGLSQAVVDELKALPWRRLAVAAEPSQAAVLSRLNEFFPIPAA